MNSIHSILSNLLFESGFAMTEPYPPSYEIHYGPFPPDTVGGLHGVASPFFSGRVSLELRGVVTDKLRKGTRRTAEDALDVVGDSASETESCSGVDDSLDERERERVPATDRCHEELDEPGVGVFDVSVQYVRKDSCGLTVV